ncbi:MAG: Gfo/Idh/MocA family oxidoreductase [Actinobacteria bacterium]|nr:Gfo/Idh/MocA family oxidoreductase [Actinomycetota bacterium]
MATYGIAIHGAGWVAGAHLVAYRNDPRARIVSISSRREETARALAQRFGLTDVMITTRLADVLARRDVDVLSICTPNDLHARETIAAAQAGKHILIEKPAALDLDSLRAMRDAVRAAGVKSVVSFVLRWNPMFDLIKHQIEAGAIGRIYLAEVDYLHGLGPWYAQYAWNRFKDRGGSSFLSAGCHAADALRYFVGSDVVEVCAYATAGSDRFEWPGTAVLICKFANGALGKSLSNLDYKCPYTFPIAIFGDGGTILNNSVFSDQLRGQTDYAEIPTILPDSGEVAHHPFNGEVAHMLDCIEHDVESHVSLERAVNTHEACIAADISAAEGRPVALPLLTQRPCG